MHVREQEDNGGTCLKVWLSALRLHQVLCQVQPSYSAALHHPLSLLTLIDSLKSSILVLPRRQTDREEERLRENKIEIDTPANDARSPCGAKALATRPQCAASLICAYAISEFLHEEYDTSWQECPTKKSAGCIPITGEFRCRTEERA
ncbi:unnamed protein product [Pleuronectes platessa]|uniref:Uncharacterized protein n=1 Tax=Pleuronectes platessa TaxID=8262 RepID=A0A9N7YPI9_PLEPL|nr:unnamed protein product [Pleuronectes platessa]